MSNKIKFKTERPIFLRSQIKTYGEHPPIELEEDDVFRLLMSSPKEIAVVDEDGNESKITWDNVTEFFPDIEKPECIKDLEFKDDNSEDDPSKPPVEGEDQVVTDGTDFF